MWIYVLLIPSPFHDYTWFLDARKNGQRSENCVEKNAMIIKTQIMANSEAVWREIEKP